MNVREGDVLNKFGTAIILAGGKSSRMGFDKQLLRINEVRLMDDVIFKIKEEFNEIIIVTNKMELYVNSPYIITRDIIEDKGPLGGIYSGLTLSSSEYAYIVACDMPNINLDYIRFMKSKVLNHMACITKYKDTIEPFNGFYSVELLKDIEKYLNENKRPLKKFLDIVDIAYIPEYEARKYSMDWGMFSNLNTPEDVDKYINNI